VFSGPSQLDRIAAKLLTHPPQYKYLPQFWANMSKPVLAAATANGGGGGGGGGGGWWWWVVEEGGGGDGGVNLKKNGSLA